MSQSIVDLFAGWGGFSAGAELAGAEVVLAANHWPLAVNAHAVNHPNTRHVCQDLRQFDWADLPAFDGLVAAPACQGHSPAAQPARKRPKVRQKHNDLRATAWAVVDCVEVTRPAWVVVENITQFREWALYPQWRSCLEAMDYTVAEHLVIATDHGVPQRRRRLFVTATLGAAPDLTIPRPDTEPAFGPCIDWNSGRWRPISSGQAGVQRRVARARARGRGRRFIGQHVTGHPGVPLHEPIRTITAHDQWFVVDGDRYRPLTLREYARGQGFADSYTWPTTANRTETIRGLGNAVPPPVGQFVVERMMRREA